MPPPPKDSAMRRSSRSYFAIGREFYDDHYSDSSIASVDEKLDFSHSIPRDQELQVLQQAYQQAIDADDASSNGNSPMVFIHGLSGTGKSTLFQQFAKSLEENSTTSSTSKPYVLRGKYQESSTRDPLSAIVEAFNGIAGLDGSILGNLRPLLGRQASSGTLMSSTANSISADDDCEDNASTATNSSTNSQTRRDSSKAWNRVKYMFRAVMMALTKQKPVVLFLDDLQWCDKASMELVQEMVLDRDLTNFLFVGAYRTSDEEEEADYGNNNNSSQQANNNNNNHHHGHWDVVRKIQKTNIPSIHLNNLSLEGMTQYLKLVLHQDQEEEAEEDDYSRLHELAQALHKITNGNIIFTKVLLEELYSKRLLSFSHMTFTWEWELEQIPMLDNVLEAVTQRIQSRTKKSMLLRNLLITMAYLPRNRVSIECLQYLICHLGKTDPEEASLIQELDKAVGDGFLVRDAVDTKSYGFAHDRIKEAAYSLMPEGKERERFRYKCGTVLYEMYENSGLDWMLLAAADHINATTKAVTKGKDAIFLTKLNLEAGERCMSVAAFDSVSKYLGHATTYLETINTEPVWTHHYDLTLQVYSLRADAELANGNWEMGYQLSKQVLEHARSIDDKLPTQLSLAMALGRQKSHDESFQLSCSTLQSMGLYPKTTFGVTTGLIRDLMYVKRYFRKKSDDEIRSLPMSSDTRMELATELYGTSMHQCIFLHRINDLVAMTLKGVRLSLQSGSLFPQTGRMITTYFFVCDALGDYQGACRFANLGLALAAQNPENSKYGFLLYMRTVFLDSWHKTPKEMSDLYETAYQRNMEAGDYESALIARASSLDHEFLAGTPLALLDIRFQDLIKRQEMCVDSLKRVTEQQWLPVRHLRGTIDTPLNFDSLADFDKDDSDKIYLIACFASRLIIAVFWGNYEFAESILAKAGPVTDKSYTGKVPRLFFTTIVYSTLYRINGNRSYRKQGKAATSELKSLSQERGMNSWHRVLIANAHIAGCSRKKKLRVEDVLREYDKGVEAALGCHHKQDAALASQLAAEFLLWVQEGGNKSRSILSTWEEDRGDFVIVRSINSGIQRVPLCDVQ
ncbi:serine threonine protein kinase [Seminavis robusta]|uniref:Serine threonine protein kinase n=1 Tax=Seminavis robusta TaxID=568900 RepID=A0A9N8E3S1_9STRA|nr:serine threonine protein kinase [Seminavis robusta]|eukprot:Sro629_g178190.1 serine threonine protein kinase (1081) ;mRNA; f:28225-31866